MQDEDEGEGLPKNPNGMLRRLEAQEQLDAGAERAQFATATLTDEQDQAVGKAQKWLADFRNPLTRARTRQVHTIGGYAGVGKTLLTGILAQRLSTSLRVAFAAPTGKASTVLGRSLVAGGVKPLFCGTVHRLIYAPTRNGGTVEWVRRQGLSREYDLIVVDEASMVGEDMLTDLLATKLPILAVGDHGQLPPVGEAVHLMSAPDSCLETVHRQALDNPVVAFATAVRQGLDWKKLLRESKDPRLTRGDVLDATRLTMNAFRGALGRPMTEDPLVLCGKNQTRVMLNNAARTGMPKTPVPGDRVICLRNAYLSGMLLANGFCGRIDQLYESTNPAKLKARVVFADEGLALLDGTLCASQFNRPQTYKEPEEAGGHAWDDLGLLFDYGYAKTAHKAQGSQADHVILLVEDFQGSREDFQRWLYTAATRCVKTLTVLC